MTHGVKTQAMTGDGLRFCFPRIEATHPGLIQLLAVVSDLAHKLDEHGTFWATDEELHTILDDGKRTCWQHIRNAEALAIVHLVRGRGKRPTRWRINPPELWEIPFRSARGQAVAAAYVRRQGWVFDVEHAPPAPTRSGRSAAANAPKRRHSGTAARKILGGPSAATNGPLATVGSPPLRDPAPSLSTGGVRVDPSSASLSKRAERPAGDFRPLRFDDGDHAERYEAAVKDFETLVDGTVGAPSLRAQVCEIARNLTRDEWLELIDAADPSLRMPQRIGFVHRWSQRSPEDRAERRQRRGQPGSPVKPATPAVDPVVVALRVIRNTGRDVDDVVEEMALDIEQQHALIEHLTTSQLNGGRA